MSKDHLEVCVVGAGPRGTSVLERLCARERRSPSHATITVHMVDPAPPGAGAVWRPDQSRHLLANTVASQITVYTDDSVRIDGPIEPGPSLYDWAREVATAGPHNQRHDADTRAEARDMGPDSYPTRAFYGAYLRDSFDRIVAEAPDHVTIQVHRSRAVAIADTNGVVGGPQGIRLEDGSRLHHLDAVILAQGHIPAALTAREARAASLARIHNLTYITPANPADVDLSPVTAGEPALLRGLGLNFCDYVALLTSGRGGVFTPVNGRLVYEPSGREPRLFASSRRGVPSHARGENEKGASSRYAPRLLTVDLIDRLRKRVGTADPVQFQRDLWPLIAREVESVYYGTLLASRGHGDEGRTLSERYVHQSDPARRTELLDEYGVAAEDRWDWERLAQPYRGRQFANRAQFRAWLLEYLAEDVRQARAGNVSGPLKAALDVLRDLRNEVRLVVDHAGLDGGSHRDELYGWYTPFNAFLSIGPPVSRIEELIALIEAGVLELTGPGTKIAIDTDESVFVCESTIVPGVPIRATVLIEARLQEPDLARAVDPLVRHMVNTEQCGPYMVPSVDGTVYETGAIAVTERPYRVLDPQGRAHPRRFVLGVPTESVHWVTAAGIRPGVDSVTLGDSDAVADTVLSLTAATSSVGDSRTRAKDGAVGLLSGVIV